MIGRNMYIRLVTCVKSVNRKINVEKCYLDRFYFGQYFIILFRQHSMEAYFVFIDNI